MGTSAHCHKAVAKVAKELAGVTYERVMGADNLVFSEWKRQNPDVAGNPVKLRWRFVMKNWGKHIDAARATLACQLRNPIDPALGEEIVEILALDSTLMKGRKNPVQVVGQLNNKQ